MRALLPAQTFYQFIAASVSALGRIQIWTNGRQSSTRNEEIDVRQAAGYAGRRAVRCNRREVVVVPVVVLNARVVDQGGRENCGNAQDALVRPIDVMRPVGWIAEGQSRSETVVAIVRIAHEQVVLGINVVIETRGNFLCDVGAGVGTLHRIESWIGGGD